MRLIAFILLLTLAGCGLLTTTSPGKTSATDTARKPPASARGLDVVMFALGLIDTGYRFGGKNPEAGLDCSGMVSYVYANAADLRLSGSAADIARRGRPVSRDALRPGDLLFFNTTNHAYSHVGIYIGDERFIHAPSSNGKVRIESLTKSWFAAHFEEARTYFD